jgi:hypothetical protein
MMKEVVGAYYKLLSPQFLGGTAVKYDQLHSGQQAPGPNLPSAKQDRSVLSREV